MKTIISIFLCLLIAVTLFLPLSAVNTTTERRAIYIVFDNSGSMYGNENLAWSQAIYAMEIFASMLNFDEGDRMVIFQMHDVTVDGSQNSSVENEVTNKQKSDIQKIYNQQVNFDIGRRNR